MITNTKRTAEKAFHLFKLVENLPLEGFERSFRMSENKLLWNRFLFGLEKQNILQEQLITLCRRMGMPKNLESAFLGSLGSANQILFGFEENDQRSVYKVYLEFWKKIRRELHTKMNPKAPVTMHIGYKWDTQDSDVTAITEYTCFPLLTNIEILERMSAIYDTHRDLPTYRAADNIVSLAAGRAPDTSAIYLEVGEESNPRRSFDINLYKAEIRLEEIYPIVERVCDHFAIPVSELQTNYRKIGAKLLGHIAGGIHRNGRDFFTIYYEEDETVIESPQSRKVGRNEPCPCGSGKKYKMCCGR